VLIVTPSRLQNIFVDLLRRNYRQIEEPEDGISRCRNVSKCKLQYNSVYTVRFTNVVYKLVLQ